jgi:L-alanine-DL-glutamate epimerase-like enolase superfamily enzyme
MTRRYDRPAILRAALAAAFPPLYGWAVRSMLRRNLARLWVGDPEPLLAAYAENIHFVFPGRSSWAADVHGADDFVGHARIAEEARTPICIGENWWGPHDVQKSLEAGACDYGMPDAMKIGGVTGWMRTAALAEPAGLPLTSHVFPEVSVHLLATSPIGHRLEYLDHAGPILQKPIRIEEGQIRVPDGPGISIEWDERAVERSLIG